MKLFLSGECGSAERESAVAHLIRNRLISYYYHGRKTNEIDELLQQCIDAKQSILLDSGAYSAFSSGVKIPLERFAEFCVKFQNKFDLIASLDVIGDADASDRNYQALLDAGATKVFPTFHYGEPFSFLEKMKKQSKVIGLGGVAQLGGGKKLLDFLDASWRRLTDKSGRPTHKVHGFAVTAGSLIMRYPWYSVDSASWLYAASYGTVAVFDNGKMNNIVVSQENSLVKQLGARHYNVLSEVERKWFLNYLAQRNITLEAVQNDYIPRQIINVHTYQLLEASAGKRLKSFQMTLLGE